MGRRSSATVIGAHCAARPPIQRKIIFFCAKFFLKRDLRIEEEEEEVRFTQERFTKKKMDSKLGFHMYLIVTIK